MKLCVLVLTAKHFGERRQACRDTWMRNIPSDAAVHFVRSFDDTQHNDEWLLGCPDTYAELPQKTRYAFRYALKCYPNCPHFFKCDDDTYVDIPRLLKFFEANRADYCGYAMTHEWPPFASGGAGYLLSRKAAAIVAEQLTDETGCEDLLVSRVLLNNKIPLTPTTLFHPWNNVVPTATNEQITAHYMTPPLMHRVYQNVQEQKIPKIFHWIWVGGKPMPEKFVEFRKGWLAKHSGWEGILWGEKNPIYPLVNQREYDAAKNPAQKADIARYEILHRYGGVYLDCDMECLQNIEPLLHGVDGFSGAESPSTVAIGIMGCVPGHPLYGKVIQALPASFAEHDNVVEATGPSFFTRHCLGREDFKIFPPWTFYPTHYNGHQWGPLEMAYATHHWSMSWKESIE